MHPFPTFLFVERSRVVDYNFLLETNVQSRCLCRPFDSLDFHIIIQVRVELDLGGGHVKACQFQEFDNGLGRFIDKGKRGIPDSGKLAPKSHGAVWLEDAMDFLEIVGQSYRCPT